MSKTDVKELSYNFALEIIKLYQELQYKKEYIISKQLLKSGTSIGANINEATAAQSKSDFIHKMSLSSKEARETYYWLSLLKDSDMVTIDLDDHLNNCKSLVNILTKIVKTSTENHKGMN